jgi:AraC family transcriptional regulator
MSNSTIGKEVIPTRNTGIFNELSGYLNVRILSCREVTHGNQWIEDKTHTHYDLWLVRSGTVSVRIGDSIHTAEEGDVIFFYPNFPYTAYTESESCRFIFILFDFGISDHRGILDAFGLCGIVPGKALINELQLIENVYDHNLRTTNQYFMRMKGCLTILLARIIELYGVGDYTGTMLNGYIQSENTGNLSSLQPIFEFIYGNLHKPIRISDLATIACLSEKYFITYFKGALGLTPGQYIYQLKMNRARDFLHTKKYAIKEIAHLLGYPDPFSFSKAFKKYYNIPPSQFV